MQTIRGDAGKSFRPEEESRNVYHPLPREWLLATNKIEVTFESSVGAKPVTKYGSGFWLGDRADTVFVTNRHVLDIEFANKKYRGLGYALSSIQILTVRGDGQVTRANFTSAVVRTHVAPTVDIALLRSIHGMRSQPPSIAGIGIVADANFTRDSLNWGTQVSFASFQPWRDTQTERPILRTGILASDPAHPFVHEQIDRTDIHLLEAFSFGGSSGSPVFANASGIQTSKHLTGGNFKPARIIGVMAGHLSNDYSDAGALSGAHTGLSYCHRSELLIRIFKCSVAIREMDFRSAARA